MTMVERVAAAIAEDRCGDAEEGRQYESAARAAILAMREPTEAMENDAGGELCSLIASNAEDPIVCGSVYRAMIDAALDA